MNTTMVDTQRETRGTVTVVSAGADEVWVALPTVFRELEIPLTTIDAERRVIGNAEFQVRRKLAGERLSAYIRCGTDSFGRPLAESYLVTAALLSYVSPLADGKTRVETRLQASAADPARSIEPVACTSTGKLEQRVAKGIELRVGG